MKNQPKGWVWGHRQDALGDGQAVHQARVGGPDEGDVRGCGRVVHDARVGALHTGDDGGLLVHVLNASAVVSEIARWVLNCFQQPR